MKDKMNKKKFSAALLSAFALANLSPKAMAGEVSIENLNVRQRMKLFCEGQIKMSDVLNELSAEEYDKAKNLSCKDVAYTTLPGCVTPTTGYVGSGCDRE